jgi:hypothetical protein
MSNDIQRDDAVLSYLPQIEDVSLISLASFGSLTTPSAIPSDINAGDKSGTACYTKLNIQPYTAVYHDLYIYITRLWSHSRTFARRRAAAADLITPGL